MHALWCLKKTTKSSYWNWRFLLHKARLTIDSSYTKLIQFTLILSLKGLPGDEDVQESQFCFAGTSPGDFSSKTTFLGGEKGKAELVAKFSPFLGANYIPCSSLWWASMDFLTCPFVKESWERTLQMSSALFKRNGWSRLGPEHW